MIFIRIYLESRYQCYSINVMIAYDLLSFCKSKIDFKTQTEVLFLNESLLKTLLKNFIKIRYQKRIS